MAKPKTVLVVCTGNICRSPIAEHLLRAGLEEADLGERFQVVSAGTAGIEGAGVPEASLEIMAAAGHDLSGHRSQGVTKAMLRQAALALCMTQDHRRHLERMGGPSLTKKLCLWKTFDPGADQATALDVKDPLGGPPAAYEATRRELLAAVPRIVAHLAKG